MKARQHAQKLYPEGNQKVTLAQIAEGWLKKLALGEIRYDPCKVESRWAMVPENHTLAFKLILNGNRKNRLEKKYGDPSLFYGQSP
jgi:hypothetical protein